MSDHQTVYLNHAGTSWPKPAAVLRAAQSAMESSPEEWPQIFTDSTNRVADFFHVDPERLLLTPSCTAALNLAIMELPLEANDRILTSAFEHHALYRNLTKLRHRGITVETVSRGDDTLVDLERLETALKSAPVRLVAMTAACNVTGLMLNVGEVVKLAHQFGALVLIDGAQIAGWWDLDLNALGVDLFTFAGHKGLQAPLGIGGLYAAADIRMSCPKATCQLDDESSGNNLPGYCDAGSVNYAALAGFAASCDWLSDPVRAGRLEAARTVAEEFSEALRRNSAVRLYHDVPMQNRMPTIAFTMDGVSNAEIDHRLRNADLVASAGFQCAPQAHETLGTRRHGVVRVSFGPQTLPGSLHVVDRLVNAIGR